MTTSLPPAVEPIYPPEAMLQLLRYLWNTKEVPQASSTLLYMALGAFAGLRPAEAIELEWKSIDLAGGCIRLVTGTPPVERIIPIQDNLREILQPFQHRRGGVVIHKKVATILRGYCEEARIKHIPNGLRRSYTAYRLALSTPEAVHAETGMTLAMLAEKFALLPTVEVAQQYWVVKP